MCFLLCGDEGGVKYVVSGVVCARAEARDFCGEIEVGSVVWLALLL